MNNVRVKKVTNVAISRFLVQFLSTFWNFMLRFGIFFALFLSFGPFTLFCRKLFWLKPCLCKKIVLFFLSLDTNGDNN